MEAFTQKYMPVKAAYTGVTESLINGKTTHMITSLSMNSEGTLSDE
jgi:hypothetical protein